METMTTKRFISTGKNHWGTLIGEYTVRIERLSRGKYMVRYFFEGMNIEIDPVSGNLEEVAYRIQDWFEMKTR